MRGQKVLIGDNYIDSFYILSVFIKIGENKLIFYYKTFIEKQSLFGKQVIILCLGILKLIDRLFFYLKFYFFLRI